MLKHNYGELYLRRIKPGDMADSIQDALAMEMRSEICRFHQRKPPIVAVRRGFPGQVMAVGYSKEEIRRRMGGAGRTWAETARFFRVGR